jgi:hypothetical protein
MKTFSILLAVLIVIGLGFAYTQKMSAPVEETPSPVLGECYVGGCSSQICSDDPDVMSTCEYREEYACYQGAVCERQVSGECGWTETEEVRACLNLAL